MSYETSCDPEIFFSKNNPTVFKGSEYYTPGQVASIMGVNRSTVHRYAHEGFLEEALGVTHIIGERRKLLFPKSSICNLFNNYFTNNQPNLETKASDRI